jgi:hypothetical protein
VLLVIVIFGRFELEARTCRATMTASMMHRRALVEKACDADILRDIISYAMGRLIDNRAMHGDSWKWARCDVEWITTNDR